jgi:hypothetical protein
VFAALSWRSRQAQRRWDRPLAAGRVRRSEARTPALASQPVYMAQHKPKSASCSDWLERLTLGPTKVTGEKHCARRRCLHRLPLRLALSFCGIDHAL